MVTYSRAIKYRQPIFTKGKFSYWHYWGFFKQKYSGLIFSSPITGHKSMERIRDESEQYIEVTDKNGKEFCVNDIITKDGKHFCIIEYENGGYYARAFSFGKYHHSGFFHISVTTKEYYIVGNKTENPELLKEVKSCAN